MRLDLHHTVHPQDTVPPQVPSPTALVTLAKHTGKTVKEIDKATAFDNFMNAKEAVEFGICDEIRNIF